MNYVITIARQFGAAGLPVAEKLAQKLGIEYFNRDLVDKAAEELQIPAAEVLEEEELKDGGRDSIFDKLYPLGNGPRSKQDKIFAAQSHVIQRLAERESCIIVGRCADFVLRSRENALHVYLYSPLEYRIHNCVAYLKMSEEEAKKVIPKAEKARNNYYSHYAGYMQDDPAHKDILINTERFGIEGTANVLEQIVRTNLLNK
ncbi:MAG: cytidylate kinase-like family protein [Lachnospiraceae bacterium]|nr:cytidylate kinase-like family protein [Lachnospiraceae bacterium]